MISHSDPVPMLTTIDHNCSGVYDSQTHSYTVVLEWNLLPSKCFAPPVTSLFNGFTAALVLKNGTNTLPRNKTFIPATNGVSVLHEIMNIDFIFFTSV